MLTIYPALKIPELEDLIFYRDHSDPNQFYALRNVPQLARNSGTPSMNFTLFKRIDGTLGQLMFTTDLGVAPAEIALAKECIQAILSTENHPFVRIYNQLFGLENSVPSSIRIRMPSWQSGKAEMTIAEANGTIVHSEVNPSLIGNNNASFSASFESEKAQAFHDALTRKYKEGDADYRSINTIVEYNLSTAAFVPPITSIIHADGTVIYRYIEQNTGIFETLGIVSATTRTANADIRLTKNQITHLLKKMWTEGLLKIELTEFELEEIPAHFFETLKQEALGLFTNIVIAKLFDRFQLRTAETTQPSSGGEKFYYLKRITKTPKFSAIKIQLSKKSATTFHFVASGPPLDDLSEEELEKVVKEIDLTKPVIQPLIIEIRTDLDFAAMDLHSIVVGMSYEQTDYASGSVRSRFQSFRFKKGAELFTFRTTMANDEAGNGINLYDVDVEIYKRGASRAQKIKLENISETELMLSAELLGL